MGLRLEEQAQASSPLGPQICYSQPMENLIFDLNSVFKEVITRLEEQGSFNQEAYYDMVEEVLEEKREAAELDDDANIEELEDKLRHRWPEAQQQFETGHDQGVIEQE